MSVSWRWTLGEGEVEKSQDGWGHPTSDGNGVITGLDVDDVVNDSPGPRAMGMRRRGVGRRSPNVDDVWVVRPHLSLPILRAGTTSDPKSTVVKGAWIKVQRYHQNY
jgi:hypothetical protein